jgi:DHA1 family tetracycline resistance protein-like MFS transporter
MAEAAASSEVPAAPEPPRGAVFAIFLIVLSDLLGFGIIIPLLPFYALKYAATAFEVGLLFSIYSACQLIAAPILGLMSDRFGRRPVLLLSQAGSVLGYLLLGYATARDWNHVSLGLGLVFLSRAIDGLSGGNISAAQAYIADVTSQENRAKGMGLLGAAFGIGFSIGPAIGGVLGHYHVSWPAFAAAVFSLFAAAQTFFRLPESRVHKPSEESAIWLHPSKFKPILHNRRLMQLQLIWFFTMMAFVMLEATFALYLNAVFGYGPREVGWFFTFIGVIIIIVQGGLIGRLTQLFGEWKLVIAGPLLVSAAMALYVEVAWKPLVWLVLVAGFFNAVGRSVQGPALQSLVSRFSDADKQGATFGLFHMLGSLARVIGPAIATLVYASHHTAPFSLAGAITLAAAIWTMLLRARSPLSARGPGLVQPPVVEAG